MVHPPPTASLSRESARVWCVPVPILRRLAGLGRATLRRLSACSPASFGSGRRFRHSTSVGSCSRTSASTSSRVRARCRSRSRTMDRSFRWGGHGGYGENGNGGYGGNGEDGGNGKQTGETKQRRQTESVAVRRASRSDVCLAAQADPSNRSPLGDQLSSPFVLCSFVSLFDAVSSVPSATSTRSLIHERHRATRRTHPVPAKAAMRRGPATGGLRDRPGPRRVPCAA